MLFPAPGGGPCSPLFFPLRPLSADLQYNKFHFPLFHFETFSAAQPTRVGGKTVMLASLCSLKIHVAPLACLSGIDILKS